VPKASATQKASAKTQHDREPAAITASPEEENHPLVLLASQTLVALTLQNEGSVANDLFPTRVMYVKHSKHDVRPMGGSEGIASLTPKLPAQKGAKRGKKREQYTLDVIPS
jgi:hypothetical protein